jgi:hypothetical protein
MENFPQALRLPGVPSISSYSGGPRPPEDDPWPACIQAWLEHQGDLAGLPQNADPHYHWHNLHVHVVALTGSAFRLGWSRRGWDMGGSCYLTSIPGSLRRIEETFSLIGRPARAWWSPELASLGGGDADPDWSEESARTRIVRCLFERRQPVIVVGLSGHPEPCLVTGYEEGGRVLYGTSIFSHDMVMEGHATLVESGEFRTEDWFSRCHGIVEPGEKSHEPDWKELDRLTLAQALDILSSPHQGPFHTGLAASTSWAETLLDDSQFEGLEDHEIHHRHACHWVTGGVLAECRAWGSWYLHESAKRHPDQEGLLLDIAVCFDMIHDLVWAVWEFTGRFPLSDQSPNRLADHGTRGRVAPLIRLIREEDAKARALIQRVLNEWDEPSEREVNLPEPPPLGYSVHSNPLAACIEAWTHVVEDPVEYDDLLAVMGGAFRRFWNPTDGGNVDIQLLHPEPIRRAAALMARDCRTVRSSKDQASAAIRASLLEGRPAIIFGIAGPPEAGLVSGISADGEVLRVQTYFSHVTDPIEVDHWHETRDPHAPVLLLILGDRLRWESPNPASHVTKTLEFALTLGRSASLPSAPNHLCGVAALKAWRDSLLEGSIYETDDPAELEIRGMVHCDQVTMTYERASAAAWLRKAADWEPIAMKELLEAAIHFSSAAELSPKLYPWGIPSLHEAGTKLRDPLVRAEIAAHIDRVIAAEEMALSSIERALSLISRKAVAIN